MLCRRISPAATLLQLLCRPTFLCIGCLLVTGVGAVRGEEGEELRVVAYNVQNYFAEEVWVDDGSGRSRPKSEESIGLLIDVISGLRPDVLGLCEIGPAPHLEDLRKRLKAAGLDYTESEHVASVGDAHRHLALLSCYPITARDSQTSLSFELNGQKEYFRRGILDVTVETPQVGAMRFVGAHLKSRRPVPEGQAAIRRHEAALLREHIEGILHSSDGAEVPLVVYGDLNDTKDEPPYHVVQGKRGADDYLAGIRFRDSQGEFWTHFYGRADVYSRVDYMLVSAPARKLVNYKACAIGESEDWAKASDHRPLLAVFQKGLR